MAQATLNQLERSFADFAAKHRLTTFSVAYRGESFGPEYRFDATGHFSDAAEGEHPCASGDGATIADALAELLENVELRRNPQPAVHDLADAPLVAEAA